VSETLLDLQNVMVLHHTEPTGFFGLWGAKPVRALDGVSLTLRRGETLGIIGGSGGGKTTLAETATLRRPADRGRILVEGRDVTKLKGNDRRKLQRRLQMIRQDARDSLEMDQSVRKQFRAEMRQYGLPEDETRIDRALERVGLEPERFMDRTPGEMSGGEQQRTAIARAFVLNPILIAADEPVSGVDPRLKEELIRLLERAQGESNIGYLLISQEFRTVRRLAHRVAVFQAGRLHEIGPAERLFEEARHPYSRFFLGLEARQDVPAEEDLAGRVIAGCPWAEHCPAATARCRQEAPVLREVAAGHAAACHNL
jgi:oligopeptide/dipeptide ABC transporter ATP-binding protein